MIPWYLHPAFRPARLQDLVLWVNSSSIFGTTWQNLAPRYTDVNHGRIIGAQVGELIHPSGVFGSALYFNGQNAYVDCGNDESLNITDEITVEAWAKTPQPTKNFQMLVTKGKDSAYELRFNRETGKVHLALKIGAVWVDQEEYDTNTVLSADTWYHVVGLYDGSMVKVYINGNYDGGYSISGTIGTNTDNLLIGKRLDGYEFNGTIDEVRIYAGALSGAEVMHNYTHSPIYYMQRGIDPLELLAMSPKEISRVVA